MTDPPRRSLLATKIALRCQLLSEPLKLTGTFTRRLRQPFHELSKVTITNKNPLSARLVFTKARCLCRPTIKSCHSPIMSMWVNHCQTGWRGFTGIVNLQVAAIERKTASLVPNDCYPDCNPPKLQATGGAHYRPGGNLHQDSVCYQMFQCCFWKELTIGIPNPKKSGLSANCPPLPLAENRPNQMRFGRRLCARRGPKAPQNKNRLAKPKQNPGKTPPPHWAGFPQLLPPI